MTKPKFKGPPHPLIQRLAGLRTKFKISQSTMSVELGYGINMVARAERGICNPSLSFISDYARYFGLELDLCPAQPALQKNFAPSDEPPISQSQPLQTNSVTPARPSRSSSARRVR